MTRFYADGRPAEIGGQPVRYDAGGRAHVLAVDHVEVVARGPLDLRALQDIEALSRVEPTTDAGLREALSDIYEIARKRLDG